MKTLLCSRKTYCVQILLEHPSTKLSSLCPWAVNVKQSLVFFIQFPYELCSMKRDERGRMKETSFSQPRRRKAGKIYVRPHTISPQGHHHYKNDCFLREKLPSRRRNPNGGTIEKTKQERYTDKTKKNGVSRSLLKSN